MTKAKSAIDKLAHLPPFDPSAVNPPDLANGESSRYETEQFQPPTTEETMKSFFPSSTSAGSPMSFHGYPHQDLCLSLQSFQNPGMVHGQSDPGNSNPNNTLYPVGFETGPSNGGGNWAPEAEMGQFSRLLSWNSGGVVGETLHSSFHPQPSIRAWNDLPMAADHHSRIPKMESAQQHHQQASMAGMGFMGFCIPPEMQGGGGSNTEDVHGINLAYHHNSTSSMSTDSSR